MAICMHLPCECEVDSQDYCGDHCEKEPQTGMESSRRTCRCGHDACGSKNDPAVST